MATEIKITKKDRFAEIIEILKSADNDNYDVYIELLEKEIEHLETKSAKAKAKAAEKKAAPDALYDAVLAALTSEYAPIADICAKVEFADATVGKITPRLTRAVAEGLAEKSDISVEGRKGKCKGYRLAATPEAE